MNLRVLTLVPHAEASASGRYRAYKMRATLQKHGVDLDVRPILDERGFQRLYRPGQVAAKAMDLVRGMRRRWEDLHQGKGYSLALVHREVSPVIGFSADRLLERQGLGWVYDFDDAVFIPNVSEANRLFSWLKPFRQSVRLAASARMVAAGNAWLADWARRQRPARPADEVEVIPTVVDTELWKPLPRDPGPPRLVWIGTPSTAPSLEPLRPVLEGLARRHPGLEFHVIGARFEGGGLTVRSHPWNRDTEVELVGRCDVGLAPLADNEWNRGKCGLKVLLYMALGLPAVASPVGVHSEMLRHGENGLLATTPEAFGEAIEAVLSDPGLHARLGAHARETVETRYSLRVVAPRLAALIKRAAALD